MIHEAWFEDDKTGEKRMSRGHTITETESIRVINQNDDTILTCEHLCLVQHRNREGISGGHKPR